MKVTDQEHDGDIGFIAQQVALVYPESVIHINNTMIGIENFNIMNQRAIVADLVAAVQNLYNQNKTI